MQKLKFDHVHIQTLYQKHKPYISTINNGLGFQYLPSKGPSSGENQKREFMCNHQLDKVHETE